jgi:hypothetical protein
MEDNLIHYVCLQGKAIVAELALLKSDVGVLDKKLGELDGKVS